MIEITHARTRKDEKNRIKLKKKSGSIQKSQKSFQTELTQSITVEVSGSLEELLNDLKDQEKNFLQYQNEYELQRYRALVKSILKQILDQNVTERTLKRIRRNRADFTIVDRINTKFLELAKAITTSNRAFNFMKTIEEIRGLVLDLVY